MSKKVIIGVLTAVLLGWIGLSSYWYSKKLNQNNFGVNQGKNNGIGNSNENKPMFAVSDGETFSISNPFTVSFFQGRSGINVPDTLTSEFAQLAVFLMNNDEKTLNIEGLYSASEPSDELIGLERAQSLKEYLVYNHGLNPNKISISPKETDQLYIENQQAIGPIHLSIQSIEPQTNNTLSSSISEAEITEELEENADSINEVSISNSTNIDPSVLRKVKRTYTMYYPPNSFYVNSTRELDRYFKYLQKYFAQNPSGQIEIKGYSDFDGNSAELKQIGKEKAELVKKHLIKEYKINSKNLKTSGASRQSAPTSTMEKAKSRKVTFEYIK